MDGKDVLVHVLDSDDFVAVLGSDAGERILDDLGVVHLVDWRDVVVLNALVIFDLLGESHVSGRVDFHFLKVALKI